jgi:hypothetical protein
MAEITIVVTPIAVIAAVAIAILITIILDLLQRLEIVGMRSCRKRQGATETDRNERSRKHRGMNVHPSAPLLAFDPSIG